MNDALHNKVVKWFYDHEELLIAIMNKTPYQSDGWDYEIEVVKEFLTQTEQESVALQIDVIVVNLVREGINKHRARELAEHFIKHTTPPQRKPLTGEQIERILASQPNGEHTNLHWFFNAVRDVETAHGIKE